MNRPNVLDGVNRSRNMMLKDRSYAGGGKPSPMDKPNIMQRPNITNTDAPFACLSVNSNYNNQFMPILPRIADPPPQPAAVRQKPPPNV